MYMTSGKTRLSTCVVMASTTEVKEAANKNLIRRGRGSFVLTIPENVQIDY